MREAFERAILERPDEIAGYAAYADWLQEQLDPRGEFIAVQLALEDESKPAAERKKLQEREAELLKAHEREWLGELAPHLLDPPTGEEEIHRPAQPEYRWRHGFMWSLTVPRLSMAFAQALADSPVSRFLGEFWLHDTYWSYYREEYPQRAPRIPPPPGIREHYEYFEFLKSPCLRNLRIFRVGNEEPPEDSWTDCHTSTPGIEHLIAGMPRVEELHLLCKDYESDPLFAHPNLSHLRVLRMYHLGGRAYHRRYEYALDTLAANPALGNLTHLLFHPHYCEGLGADMQYHSYLPLAQVRSLVRSPHLKSLSHLQLRLSDMGDNGVREIISSGILKRLKWLDLRHGCITDEGAKLFAKCPDTRNLERLDLSRNVVTANGLNALQGAGVNAVANNPMTDQEVADLQYLREGDFE
jgi:uncharacterized protein (TIGR02996 family)